MSSWDADHIVPLCESGAVDIENVRTLCRPCHIDVTRDLRRRIALRRQETRAERRALTACVPGADGSDDEA